VAHVVQANRHSDVVCSLLPTTLPFELQVFEDLVDAQQWLRECRDHPQPGK
jgi:hypothetical protein